MEDLRDGVGKAKAAWRERQQQAQSADLSDAVERRLAELDAFLRSRHDRPKAHHLLLEIQTLLQGRGMRRDPAEYFDPPRSDFEDDFEERTSLIMMLEQADRPAARPLQADHKRLEAEGRAAQV